ncbi:MAG: hypothetical protein RLZ17_945 [Actinomycetota bacterium]
MLRPLTRSTLVALRADARERYSFATLSDAMEIPNLIGVQRESFEWFLTEGLREVFEDISPVKGVSDDLQLELTFDPDDADLNPKPKFTEAECRDRDMTYSVPKFVIKDKTSPSAMFSTL